MVPSDVTAQSTPMHYVASVDAFQQILFDEVLAGRHMVGSFPVTQSFLPAYAFTALNLPGLTIVVCLDADHTQLNCDTLSLAGAVYPEVAAMDGTQPPQLVREIYESINRRQTRLLYVTPQTVETLPFLQMMTHTTISMVVVEEAQYFLPFHRETVLLPLIQGFHRLATVPPICFLCGPIPSEAPQYLSALFPTRPMASYQVEMTLIHSQCVVHPVVTRKQKFGRLQQILIHPPSVQDNPVMPTLIITPNEEATFQVVTGLDQLGVEPVYIYPSESPRQDNRALREILRRGGDRVLVAHLALGRFLVPPVDVPFRLVYWSLPDSLSILYAWLATPVMMDKNGDQGILENHRPQISVEVFYAKEDYQHRLQHMDVLPLRLQTNRSDRLPFLHSLMRLRQQFQRGELKAVREFSLSETCRLLDVAMANGVSFSFDEGYTCGWCDVCQGNTNRLNAGFFMKSLQRLWY